MPVDVAIVGGGISGLATAYELSRRRRSFVVLEQAARAGGVIISEEASGFTIDGGPDALLIQKPAAQLPFVAPEVTNDNQDQNLGPQPGDGADTTNAGD